MPFLSALGLISAVGGGSTPQSNVVGASAGGSVTPTTKGGSFGGLVTGLLPSIGGLFKGLIPDGRFDCIGASWSESRAQSEHENYLLQYNSRFSLIDGQGSDLVSKVNSFLKDFAMVYLEQVTYQRSGAPKDCTKRGIDLYVSLMNTSLREYVSAAKSVFSDLRIDYSETNIDLVDSVGKYRGEVSVPQFIYRGQRESVIDKIIPDSLNPVRSGALNRLSSSGILVFAVAGTGLYWLYKKVFKRKRKSLL
ncbi:hypothetical protein GWK08_08835 [Leptobacterium flavescens]|uniref:Uncharacterized protein n=1 Tax=Leptobacterium flavescens TaxID=472055 RepID=A0A6P0UNW7_9FLAO|nr:hypothetical protein [Leptobacterium flavescens]NER13539.1 hypothetical protein [Leptobacterium flavescens]